MQGRYMLRNLLTFSHTRQPITTIVYTYKKMGVNEPSANNLTFATNSDTILRMPRKNKILNIGDTAPVFTLPSHQRKKVSLETYRETQHVVLTFFRGTW